LFLLFSLSSTPFLGYYSIFLRSVSMLIQLCKINKILIRDILKSILLVKFVKNDTMINLINYIDFYGKILEEILKT